jgi:hypothetical protein
MPPSREWVLCAGAAPSALEHKPLEPWVEQLASGPRVVIGELEDGVPIHGVLPLGWHCAVLPDYILPHTLVAAVMLPSGAYAMLFLAKASAEFHRQERPATPSLLGWFHLRLCEPVIDERSLRANLVHAFGLLQSHGIVTGPASPRSDA